MNRWLAIPLLLSLCALGAAAQDQPLTLAHKAPCFVCESFTVSYQPSEPTITLAENLQPKPASRALLTMTGELDLEAWERLHQTFHRTFPMQHNPRLYALTARILTSFYSVLPFLPIGIAGRGDLTCSGWQVDGSHWALRRNGFC